MATIPASVAKRNITKASQTFIENYVRPQTHFSEIFGKDMADTELISWEEVDYTESVADDTARNSSGNANSFKSSVEKITSSPEFHEKFTVNQLLSSVIQPGESENIPSKTYDKLLKLTVEKTEMLAHKITRAIEKASAQFFDTGIMNFKTAGEYDWNRPSESLVDLVGTTGYLSNVDADIIQMIADVADYFRDYAFWTGTEFDWTLSRKAVAYLEKTTWAKENYNRLQVPDFKRRNNVNPDQRTSQYYGTIEVAGVTLHLYIYSGKAEGVQGGTGLEYYLPQDKSVFTPTGFELGGIVNFPIDAIMGDDLVLRTFDNGFYTWKHHDTERTVVEQHIKGRMLPVPRYHRRAYTAKVF